MKNLLAGIVIAGLIVCAAFLYLQRQAQEKLRAEDELLRQQITQLKADNVNLSNAAAQTKSSQSLPDEQFNELLKLRGEVTRLQADSEELAKLRAANAQRKNVSANYTVKYSLAKVNELKQRLNQMQDKQIPELQFLAFDDWQHAAELNDLKSDDDIRSAFSDLRARAKNNFGVMIHSALWNYLQANNGILPDDISQLQPYFKTPLDESILSRYELLHAGKLADVPNREPLVLEKSPVDEKYDTRLEINMAASGSLGLEAYSNTSGLPLGN